MSGRKRILKEIEDNKKLIEEIEKEIKEVEEELKNENLSEKEKHEIEQNLQNLDAEKIDIGFDIAILQEIFDKYDDEETYCGYSCDGKCQICIKYMGGYDPLGEI